MPRGPRLDAPGLLHHVRARGIERRKIFLSDLDRKDFIERLGIVCQKEAAFVYAWALLPNHVHMAIRTGSQPLSTTIRKLLTGYAVAFNLRHRRVGHLFQNRFWSKVVEDETYFLALIRYIHLNPVRARIVTNVRELKEFPWTGHAALMGRADHTFQDTEEVLGRFGSRSSTARRELVDFMLDPEAQDETWIFQGGGLLRSKGHRPTLEESISRSRRSASKHERQAFDDRILGDGKFVESVLGITEEPRFPTSQSPGERSQRLKKLIEQVGKRTNLQFNELVGRGRRREVARVRWAIAWIATRHLGMTASEVAKEFGQDTSAITKRAVRGKSVMVDLGLDLESIISEL